MFISNIANYEIPSTPLLRRPSLKTQRVNFKPPPTPPTFPIWKPPLYRERKALFRSDGVLQSAPVILHPTQTGQSATNTVRRRRVSASDFRRGTIRKRDLLRQSEPGKLSAIRSRVRIEQWQARRVFEPGVFCQHLDWHGLPSVSAGEQEAKKKQKNNPGVSTLV